ncbi:YebC/PmpR family DNA-binding transcriptional regulator [Dehalococcoides mccartyi]|uniref:Probable transcriptional regulatory protein VLL09_03055 n=1 Tax=Dehalococcoides mccartyi TaxID=61435 RepID=A0AB38ZBA8_9CHLR|nr:YebC/PmpR family DNA-binding transcriptional regulator [Dehalococcoides mccartyi]POZ58624.1 hypothetical protein YebC [Dehalococcoides mccartyi]WRO07881.1 YebC/PmpR family DNA-binding transcriptional regulator [Dehalococcoides mccartyi]
MSGHSKWATIKHAKGAADAKRGQLFTKLSREIIFAAKQGGSSPEGNARLRLAIQKAKDNRMPSDNIERAIKKGSGELEGATVIEMILEGYGPGGVAVLVNGMSDNRNRTVSDVRHMFSKSGGSLAESGAVSWIFETKGVIGVETVGLDTDELSLKAIDMGAEDVNIEEDYMEIYTAMPDMEKVRQQLEAQGVTVDSAEINMIPKNTVKLDEETSLQVLKLLDKLEELDDVQTVSSNADFDPEVVEKYHSQA